jgi:signal transduction histidine kinase
MRSTKSLKHEFMRQLTRWSIVGVVGSGCIALLFVSFLGVRSTESAITITARSAVSAFSAQILAQNIDSAEKSIRNDFKLSGRESVTIRDSHFKRIYERGDLSTPPPACGEPNTICWDLKKYRVSTLVPIYFDASRPGNIYGYLELNLTPHFDFTLLIALFCSILGVSIIQALGLSSRSLRLVESLKDQLNEWGEHIRDNPKENLKADTTPYDELRPLQSAIFGLNSKIETLEIEARDSGKLSVIRGISHDLLSPISQLQKMMAMLEEDVSTRTQVSDELVQRMQRSLARLTSMAEKTRQLQSAIAPTTISSQGTSIDLSTETSLLLSDLQRDSEIENKKISLLRSGELGPVVALVAGDDYTRIVSNLVRNAAQASNRETRIEVETRIEFSCPTLIVRDEGQGIPTQIRKKIFDLDFTTKPNSGTGLGLTIVRELCAKNHAEISFASKEGQGTEFRIRFKADPKSLEVAV